MNSSNPFIKILPSGLRSQLILGISFIIVVSISLFVVDQMGRQKAFFLKLNHDRGIGLSENLANISTSHVAAYEVDGLQNLITTYKKIPGIEYAMVTSADGIVLAHTNKKYLGLLPTDSVSAKLKPTNITQVLLENNDIFDVASPIVKQDEIIGWARIGLSQKYLTANLSDIRNRGILYIIISLIFGSLFAIIVANRLTKGLQKLVTTANKITGGSRSIRAESSKTFEVLQLGTAFNQMLDNISSNEKLLGMVLENLPVGVWILDEKGQILSVNAAGEDMWKGVKFVGADEYNVYKGWFTETGKEVQNHEWGASIVMAEGRPVLNQEIEIECFDKSRKIILNSAIPLRDANEKLTGIITINVDITERKQAEHKLRESREQLTLFIEHSPAALAMFDVNMRYIATSRRWLNDYNLGNQNIIGKTHYEIFPEISQEWKDIHQRSLNGAIERREEDSFKRLDGTTDWLRWEIRPWHNSIGKIGGIITFTEVITERKIAEIKLEQSEEKNRALVENIGDGIVVLNENREIIYQSPSVKRINGYTLEERKDKSAEGLIFIEDKDGFKKFLDKVYLTPNIPMQSQFRMTHKNGNVIWIEGSMVNMLNNESVKGIIVNYRDVTERKKATELFRYQFENSPDIILIINKDLIIESINRGRLNGPSITELIGKNSIDVLPEESRTITREGIFKCFETGQNQEFENTLVDGRWVRSRLVPIRIDGKITHIMIIATDITERKHAVEKLRQSEEKNRALIENISDTIVLVNEKLEVIYQSPSFIRTAGFSLDDHKDKTVMQVLHPDELDMCMDTIHKSKISPGIAIPFQFRTLHKEGYYIWVEGTVTNLLNNESVKAFVLNYRNITERKKFEEQQLLITSIVNSSDDAIFSNDLNGMVTSWNRGAEHILGYSPNEIIGKSVFTFFPDELKFEEHTFIENIKKGISTEHFETKRIKKGGQVISISITVSPIRDTFGNITGVSKVVRDISEQKAMELEREKTMTELLQRNRDLEQFSFIVSHNLRGPVATIMGLSDILQSVQLSPKEKDQLVTGMGKSARNLDMVINDLNTILKVKRDVSEKKETVQFSELIHDIQGSLASVIAKEKVEFICSFTESNQISTLKSYLYSICYNLISNSIKYHQPGINPIIEITSERKDNKTILRFRDNGLGIDMTKKGKEVFGLYKRFHFHTEGKGMGLYMVKTQVQALGGHISIESEVNKGTQFTIEFEN